MTVELHLGDCLEVIRSIPDKSVDAVITDPPYGMSLDTDYSGIDKGGGKKYKRVEGDDKRFDPNPFLALGKTHIFFGAQYFCHSLPEVGGWIVFNKRGQGKTSEIFFFDFEFAWCDSMQSVRMYSEQWHGYYRTAKAGGGLHPTQKPVGLMKWCIEKYTNKGDTILDPFMGSGTTGVACANLDRKFIGIEIEEKYFDIACKRIEIAYSQPRLFDDLADDKSDPVEQELGLEEGV